jgi:DNA-binding SARP family transcriptional activator
MLEEKVVELRTKLEEKLRAMKEAELKLKEELDVAKEAARFANAEKERVAIELVEIRKAFEESERKANEAEDRAIEAEKRANKAEERVQRLLMCKFADKAVHLLSNVLNLYLTYS